MLVSLPRMPDLRQDEQQHGHAPAPSARRRSRSAACSGVARGLASGLFCSSAVSLRPVRPRDSIEPAALPRCLVRLLRFVWAMAPTRVDDLRAVSGPGAARLRGKSASAARGAGATSSAPVTRACARTARDHLGRGDARVVLDVGGDLRRASVAGGRARGHRARSRRSLRDRLGGLERRVDLDVEGDQRRAGGDERGAGRGMARRAEVGLEAVEAAGRAQLRAGPAAGRARRRDRRGCRAGRARRRARAPRRTRRRVAASSR